MVAFWMTFEVPKHQKQGHIQPGNGNLVILKRKDTTSHVTTPQPFNPTCGAIYRIILPVVGGRRWHKVKKFYFQKINHNGHEKQLFCLFRPFLWLRLLLWRMKLGYQFSELSVLNLQYYVHNNIGLRKLPNISNVSSSICLQTTYITPFFSSLKELKIWIMIWQISYRSWKTTNLFIRSCCKKIFSNNHLQYSFTLIVDSSKSYVCIDRGSQRPWEDSLTPIYQTATLSTNSRSILYTIPPPHHYHRGAQYYLYT
jgi:hypothetical protein